MAICTFCELEMTTARSCTVEVFHRDGRPVPLMRYGSEPDWPHPPPKCGDCGVALGGLHHPGCDLQCCPRCAGQLLSCGCRFDEDGLEDDDDPFLDAEPFGVDVEGRLMERAVFAGGELVITRDDVPESDITILHGIRVTTPVRSIIDAAPEVGFDVLREMVADALDRRLFTRAEAWERLGQADMAVRVGAELLREALRSLD